MSKSSLRMALSATAAFAGRNGIDMSMSAIPDNVEASSLKFDSASMRALFDLGRTRSQGGEAWSSVGPSGRPTPLPSQQARPEQIPDVLQPAAPAGSDAQGPAADDGALQGGKPGAAAPAT